MNSAKHHRFLFVLLLAFGCIGEIRETRPQVDFDPGPDGQCGASVPAAAPLRRLTAVQLGNTVRALFDGRVSIEGIEFPAGSGLGVTGYATEATNHEPSGSAIEAQLDAAEGVALRAVEAKAQLWPCSNSGGEACRDSFLADFLGKAFRRPPTSAELASYRNAFDAAAGAATFDDGLATVITVALQSPAFLYQVEASSNTDVVVDLSQHELAQRLALLFWDSAPDATLRGLADRGELTGDRIEAEARRLLNAPEAEPTMSRFFREWAELPELTEEDKDRSWFPAFSSSLAWSMNTEFDLFVRSVVRTGGTMRDLLTSNRTYANAELARFMGVPAPVANGSWGAVTTDAATRAGLLTRPALLAGFAHTQEPSHVHRGLFVLDRMLCEPVGAAPNGALAREPGAPAGATGRQRSEARRQVPGCDSCHNVIDPIGLTFENYDAVGTFRTSINGAEVNASGTLPEAVDVGGDYNNLQEMTAALAESEDARACLARQWFRNAFARLETNQDRCTVEAMLTDWKSHGERLDELMLSVVRSNAFRSRVMEVSR